LYFDHYLITGQAYNQRPVNQCIKRSYDIRKFGLNLKVKAATH